MFYFWKGEDEDQRSTSASESPKIMEGNSGLLFVWFVPCTAYQAGVLDNFLLPLVSQSQLSVVPSDSSLVRGAFST